MKLPYFSLNLNDKLYNYFEGDSLKDKIFPAICSKSHKKIDF